MRSRHLLTVLVLAAAAALPPTAAVAQRAGAARPDAAMQQQLLDANKRANEAALEQAKATLQAAATQSAVAAEEARKAGAAAALLNKQAIESIAALSAKSIESTQSISAEAVKTAQASNAYAETIFKTWTVILGVVLAVAAFFGWKAFSDIKTTTDAAVATAVAEMKEKADAALKDIVDKMEQQKRALFTEFQSEKEALILSFTQQKEAMAAQYAALVAQSTEISRLSNFLNTDMASYNGRVAPVFEKTPSPPDPLLVIELFQRLVIIEGYATKLDDVRTASWVASQRALLYFYTGRYKEALAQQEISCTHTLPHTRFDRLRNLACMASKVFEIEGDRAALQRSVEALTECESFVVPEQAKLLLGDPDLAAVFAEVPERKRALEVVAAR